MLSTFDGATLALREIDRFDGFVLEGEEPRWDVPALKRHVDHGLRIAAASVDRIHSIGVDSWGLDYALLGKDGEPIVPPYHYRHPRSLRGFADCRISRERIFSVTGAQVLAVNTVFQLHDEIGRHPDRFDRATALLMMADLINHHLTGACRNATTLARTSGLLEVDGRSWSRSLLGLLGVPESIVSPLVEPGDIYGHLRPDLCAALNWSCVPVAAVAAHDTASAVVGLPLGEDDAFVIGGSWSLIGAEVDRPIADEALFAEGFGIEGGAGASTFLVKSFNGLHLVQKLRAAWSARLGRTISFADIAASAEAVRHADIAPIDPSDPAFFDPADVVAAANAFHRRHGQPALDSVGALAISIYKGLVRDLSGGLRFLEARRGRPFERVRLCGGGALDAVFASLLADGLGRIVVVGPVEASAWGNAVMQLRALRLVASVEEGRRLIARSLEFRIHRPSRDAATTGAC
ncbi:hypothetical protein ASG43_12130 [Aureimonas sp. Leaf454]|uniref:rhamnulokinase n=1 Tax=Aureimonas sp. Leaf454 TaxID=1736381 RepID=UPI0006FE0B08|nr:FGGY-family carbohydrate kinase [Aureimonas sp. Leaf454]KQT46361.1 hypothetical protein ASG43_12130 [Aureimonas sp. Leaf454]